MKQRASEPVLCKLLCNRLISLFCDRSNDSEFEGPGDNQIKNSEFN